MKICTFPGCDRPLYCSGLCVMHRERKRTHGSPYVKLNLLNATPAEEFVAFWKKVEREGSCWIWTGYKYPRGYGHFRKQYAHRFSYERMIGPIPKGMFVCHRCDNPSCVRPSHLYAGTREDNTRDALERHRFASGSRNKQTKLSEESIRTIVRLKGRMFQREIGEIFGVSQTEIGRVFRGEIWKHVRLQDVVSKRKAGL